MWTYILSAYFIIIELVLKSCIIITTKFLKELFQKKNNCFLFEILCQINNKIIVETVKENQKTFMFVFVFRVLPKQLETF